LRVKKYLLIFLLGGSVVAIVLLVLASGRLRVAGLRVGRLLLALLLANLKQAVLNKEFNLKILLSSRKHLVGQLEALLARHVLTGLDRAVAALLAGGWHARGNQGLHVGVLADLAGHVTALLAVDVLLDLQKAVSLNKNISLIINFNLRSWIQWNGRVRRPSCTPRGKSVWGGL